MFITLLQDDPRTYFSWIIIVTFSICVHEWSHAAMALRCGDDTAARNGHLSLNPLVQMGPTSLFFLFFIGIAWGAVPVDVSQLRKRSHEAWVSFAGPLSNLVLLVTSGFLLVLLSNFMRPGAVLDLLYEASRANGVLFLLNMLPVPSLDGWSVLAHFFPQMKMVRRETANSIATFFILAIFVTPLGGYLWKAGEVMGLFVMGFWQMMLGVVGL